MHFQQLPSYDDINSLASLTAPSAPAPAPASANSAGSTGTGNRNAPANIALIQNRVQNPHRDQRYVGNTPLAVNVRTRSIRNAIALAGNPPQVTRDGTLMPTCLSWHVKGSCSEDCARRADHTENAAAEREALYQWCVAAFA